MPLQFSQRRLEAPLPVHVLTGFLGSGKTTVLRHLLQSSGMEKAAVVINEFEICPDIPGITIWKLTA